MGAVWPVVAKEAPMTEFVLVDFQSVGRNAFVADGIAMLGSGNGGRLEDEVDAVLCEGDGLVVLTDGKNGHAFAGAVLFSQVELELVRALAKLDGYDCGAADAVAVVIEGERKVVVLDVDDGVV